MKLRSPNRGNALRRFPVFSAIGIATFIFLYFPMAIVVVYAFNANEHFVTIWGGFTTQWFGIVVNDEGLRQATLNSLEVAAVATLGSVVLATAAALGLVALSQSKQRLALGLIGIPLVVPEIVLAIATLALFALGKFPLGIGTMMIAHTALCLPFVLLPIRARLQALPPALFEAASDLGAPAPVIVRRITLPLLAPAILAGGLLAFILSLDDFLMAFFLAGPSATTLPLYLFGEIKQGLTPAINAVSTILIAVSALFVIASYLLNRRERAQS